MDFIQARYYTPTGGRNINLIVVHTMESEMYGGVARGCAGYFSGPNAPRASAHYNVDPAEVVQSVRDQDIAWHAAENRTNNRSIGIEHAGRAAYSDEWYSAEGLSELNVSADLIAQLCDTYGIPVRWLGPGEVASGQAGICGHSDVTYGYNIYGGHTDPGDNFPRDYLIGLVASKLGQNPAPPAPSPGGGGQPTLSIGSNGSAVTELQQRLANFGYWITVDGSFGPATEAIVKDFQAEDGTVAVDGVVGPATWAAIDRAEAGNWHKFSPSPSPAPAPAPAPAPESGHPTLSVGSSGSAVTELQQRLAAFGYAIAADGSFGPITEAIVKDFQAEDGTIAVDGVVGPATWDAISRAEAGNWHKNTTPPLPPAPAAPSIARPTPTLKRGSVGPEVYKLQTALNVFNAGLAADGQFGPATENAVKAFQAFWKLSVDGIYGPQTAKMLSAALTWNGR